jgi:hypothetical protein
MDIIRLLWIISNKVRPCIGCLGGFINEFL